MTNTKLSKQEVVCDKCGDLIPMNKTHICNQDGEKDVTVSKTLSPSSPPSCPQCGNTLERNTGWGSGEKPSSDWFCERCFKNRRMKSYTFYHSEVKEARGK